MRSNKLARDRREEKTERQLRDALVSLMHEKDYDAIAVKEILDRADVGRSTFYEHFHDKDALLASGIDGMLGPAQPRDPLWFSRPIFEHHERHRGAGPRMSARGRAVVHDHLRRRLTRLLTEEAGSGARGRIPSDLLVRHIASTFVLVLNWWAESRRPLPASEVDGLFRAMVGLSSAR